MEKNLSIKNWAEQDRPREKLLQKGINSLSDAELLAILISSGTKKLSAVDLAKVILSKAENNLHLLGKKTIHDLIKINGIGQAKAITIMAALELGKRRKNADLQQIKIRSSKEVYEIMQPILGDLLHEEFWVIYMNKNLKIIEKKCISTGGVSAIAVDTKKVLKSAIENSATSIILVHNHPSGNDNPSQQDKDITEKIKKAADLFDVVINDHIIIADKKYFSFADDEIL